MGIWPRIRHILLGAWWRKTIIIAAILVILYAALGFLALPAIVQWQLPKFVAEHTTAKASVGKVAFNPFTFDIRATDFDMTSDTGQALIRLRHLDVNFDPARLLHRRLAFAWIHLDQPRVNVVIDADGHLNFASIMRTGAHPAPEKPQRKSALPRIVIDDFSLADGCIEYSDRSQGRDFHTQLSAMSFHLQHFSTQPDASGQYRFQASLGPGQSLAWGGTIGVAPLYSQGQLRVQGLDLAHFWPYVADRFKVSLAQGQLGAQAAYSMREAAGGLQLDIHDGEVHLDKLALVRKGDNRPLVSVPELDFADIDFSLAKRKLKVGKITTQGGRITAELAPDHQIDLVELFKPVRPVAREKSGADPRPAKTPAADSASTRSPAIRIGEIDLQGYGVTFTDASGAHPVVLHLRPIDVSVKDYSSTNEKPLALAADAGVNGGTLHATGTVVLKPLAVHMNLKLADLPLPPFQPYVDRFARLRIKRGRLGVEGKIMYRTENKTPDIAFDGQASLSRLDVESAGEHQPFVQLALLSVEGIHYANRPAELRVQRVDLDKPFARLVVAPDHTTNISAIFADGRDDKANATPHPRPKRSSSGKSSTLPVTVHQIRVKEGKLQFADLSMKPNVSVGIEALNGDVRKFSTKPGETAAIDLKGEVGPYAPVTIKGTINPLGKTLAGDIAVRFKNLGLTAFSPYSGKFAGYRIKKGKADLTLQYNIHDGLMEGKNNVVIDQLQLGERVDSPQAIHVPLRLAIALLKDSHGVINLDLPVHGDLNDPQFAIGPLLWKVFVNVLSKVVTSPFHLLAGLVQGNANQLDHVTFAPGRASLAASEQGALSKLASALEKRPKLQLDVAGVVAPSVDGPALARQQLLAQIRKEEPRPQSDETLTPQDQKRLLEQYEATFKVDPDTAIERAPKEPDAAYRQRVAQAALKRLVAHIQLPPGAFEQLAEARAEAVRHYLVVQGGLDPSRIFLIDPDLQAKAQNGGAMLPLQVQVH